MHCAVSYHCCPSQAKYPLQLAVHTLCIVQFWRYPSDPHKAVHLHHMASCVPIQSAVLEQRFWLSLHPFRSITRVHYLGLHPLRGFDFMLPCLQLLAHVAHQTSAAHAAAGEGARLRLLYPASLPQSPLHSAPSWGPAGPAGQEPGPRQEPPLDQTPQGSVSLSACQPRCSETACKRVTQDMKKHDLFSLP